MSASVMLRQVKPLPAEHLSCGAGSWFGSVMREAFGNDGPWVLTKDDVPVLRGLSASMVDAKDNPFREIIQRIEELAVVEVYLEY